MMALHGRASKIMIAHENFVDDPVAIVSSPMAFAAGLPLANVRNDRLTKPARSLSGTMTIDLDFGQRVPITIVAALAHNLTENARWRIVAADERSGAATNPGGYVFPEASKAYDSRPALASTTSTTPLTIGVGNKTLRVAGNLFFQTGASVRLAAMGVEKTVYMDGTVVSYDAIARTLLVNVTASAGTGTVSDWKVTRFAQDISVWPDVTPFAEGGYWGRFVWGGILPLVGKDYLPPALHLPMLYTGDPNPIYARYMKIEIVDPSLSFIDIGRLVVGPGYQPSINISYGWQIEFVDPSQTVRSRGGQFYADVRPKYRVLTCALQNQERDEIFSNLYEIDRILGVSKPLLVIVDPTDVINIHRLTIYGSQVQTSPISNPANARRHDKEIQIQEWL
jgi:hypothetical protein